MYPKARHGKSLLLQQLCFLVPEWHSHNSMLQRWRTWNVLEAPDLSCTGLHNAWRNAQQIQVGWSLDQWGIAAFDRMQAEGPDGSRFLVFTSSCPSALVSPIASRQQTNQQGEVL